MGHIARFLGLRRSEKTLLLGATLLLAAARLGLYALSFARLRSVLGTIARARGATDRRGDAADRIVWAVETASRQFPAIGTCLTQALTGHVLLARNGVASDLRIGVMRTSAGQFVAHAWLEKEGRVILGETDHGQYTPMPALNLVKP